MVSRALRVLLHALLSAFASSSPDGGLPEVEQGLAAVEPDLRVVARRGPSGFGVVVRLSDSSWGEVNLVTGLRGPAAEDGLLRVGDLVLENAFRPKGGRQGACVLRPEECSAGE